MATTITGKILSISPTVSLTTKSGNPFTKRELVLDCTRFDPYTGERSQFENTPMIEFIQDKCALLDGLKIGQVVTVNYDLQGMKVTNAEGRERYINSVRGFKVELRGHQPQPQQTQASTINIYQQEVKPVTAAPSPTPQPQATAQSDGLPF
jgi:hypothetical protein